CVRIVPLCILCAAMRACYTPCVFLCVCACVRIVCVCVCVCVCRDLSLIFSAPFACVWFAYLWSCVCVCVCPCMCMRAYLVHFHTLHTVNRYIFPGGGGRHEEGQGASGCVCVCMFVCRCV